MSEYIVSARKYRPDSFESLIGQDNIAQSLRNSIKREQLAHAYLFCGPRGVGKTSAARIFAKTINCSNPGPEMEPCGECESCRSFQEGRSYCIHELDAASNNGVEDIRALVEQVQVPPQVGRYSVYIIDEVHMLSQAAFNAFLKTLEEPPAHAIFILATTEKHKIIATILSRCQTYDFNRITIPDIVNNLKHIAECEGVNVDDESLHVIAHKADGAMRDALTIFDQTVAFCGTDVRYDDVIRNLNVLDYEYSFKLVNAFLTKDYPTALLVFDEVLRKGFNALYFVSSLASHVRDLMVSRSGALASLLDMPESLAERYRVQAQSCSTKFLFDALQIIAQCEAGYRAAANQRLHIEFALMKLSFLGGLPAEAPVVTAPQQRETATPQPESQVEQKPIQIAASTPTQQTAAQSLEQKSAASQAKIADSQTFSQPLQTTEAGQSKREKAVIDLGVQTAAQKIEPTPAQSERKPRARSKSSLSMDDIMKGEMEMLNIQDSAASLDESSQTAPTEEVLKNKWKELAQGFSNSPRLMNALLSTELQFEESTEGITIIFTVMNESQKMWIEANSLRKIESEIQRLTAYNKIKVLVRTIPEEKTEHKIYLPSEMAQDLMQKNEEFRELVTDLQLDV